MSPLNGIETWAKNFIAKGCDNKLCCGMKDYSQSGEQAVIMRYFTGRERGMLLDVGANDGETFSMSRALLLDGWKGVLVEPSPAAFEKLVRLYQVTPTEKDFEVSQNLVNAAITVTYGPIDLYDSGTHLKKGDVALLSTTVPSEMNRWKKSGEVFTKTTARGIEFSTLMKETGVSHFDFISIDAEGMDVAILHQIDLTEVGCQLLCIEFNQNREAEAAIRAYCQYHGMKLLHRTYENLLFSR